MTDRVVLTRNGAVIRVVEDQVEARKALGWREKPKPRRAKPKDVEVVDE